MAKKQTTAPEKKRGGWLSAWLSLIMIHGAFAAFLVLYLRAQRDDPSPSWVLLILFLLALADILAAIAAWNWKKWGLWLYVISTAAGIAIGLILTRSQLIVFHDIVPLVILGLLIRDKRSYFD